jgi:hypothetical protein
MRLLVIVVLAACWREAPPRTEPELSFVARVNALVDLRRNVDALEPKLEAVMHRILGLASEAERDAIRQDLSALAVDVARFADIADASRARGDDPVVLDEIDRKLERAELGLANLRDELLHAKTIVEQRALDEQRKLQDASDADVRSRIYRRRDTILLPAEQKPDLPQRGPRPIIILP